MSKYCITLKISIWSAQKLVDVMSMVSRTLSLVVAQIAQASRVSAGFFKLYMDWFSHLAQWCVCNLFSIKHSIRSEIIRKNIKTSLSIWHLRWYDSENQRLRAIGMLQAGVQQNVVAQCFGVHRNTIGSLWQRFQHNGNNRDNPWSGRPWVMSHQQDNHIRLTHLRNRFQTATLTARSIPGLRPISPRTVRNHLCEFNICPRRPAIRPLLTQRHHNARLTWCQQRLRYMQRQWSEILFTDESRFHIDISNEWQRVYRRTGKRFSDACVIKQRPWGGGASWRGAASLPMKGPLLSSLTAIWQV